MGLDQEGAGEAEQGGGAEEQLGGDVAIGEPLCDEPGDLQLLSGQIGDLGGFAAARRLAGGSELLRGPLEPVRGVEVFE